MNKFSLQPRYWISSAPLALTAALLIGCGATATPEAPLPPAVAPVAAAALYTVTLVDAFTGAPITDSLSVTYSGTVALVAADGTSLNGKTVTVKNGVLAFGATFTATATDINILVGNPTLGWANTGLMLSGNVNTKAIQSSSLKMLNTSPTAAAATNASTAAIATKTETVVAAAGGVIATAVTAASPPKQVVNETTKLTETLGTASVTIPPATTGKAADGTPAAAGAVTLSATLFSTATSSALEKFPGGFATDVTNAPAADLNGSTATEGSMTTAGFASFSVTDSAGKAITTFDKPLTLVIDMPKSTTDEAGVLLTVGSKIPVWSFNEKTNEWVWEKEGTVAEKTPVDASNFGVSFSTNHLSYWNLGFRTQTCTHTLNFAGRPAGDARPLTVILSSNNPGQAFRRPTTFTDSQVIVTSAPVGVRATVEVREASGTLVGSAGAALLCQGPNSGLTTNIGLTNLTPVASFGSVQVTTTEGCANRTTSQAVPASLLVTAGTGALSSFLAGASGTTGIGTIANVPAGTATVSAQNPRNPAESLTSQVTVAAGATANAAFRFTLPVSLCPTGAN